ncbi:DBH-like monooxygenase protein 2 homolog, partial [Cetorhinus maximus]
MSGRASTLLAIACLLPGVTLALGAGLLPHQVELAEGFHLSWEVDVDSRRVTFLVLARTLGWVGVGLTPTGGMDKADVVIGWVKDGQAYFHDRHGVGNNVPVIDDSQDYQLMGLVENETHTEMRFRRPFRTCDPQDLDITDDTLRVIFACGISDPTSLTEVPYHGAAAGIKSARLLNYARISAPQPNNSSSISLTTNLTIPEDSTFYSCQIGRLPNLGRKHHVYMVETSVPQTSRPFVHHILLFLCPGTFTSAAISGPQACYARSVQMFYFARCTEVLAGWAVGGQDLIYPDDAGFPLGGADDPVYYMLQIHYDNPQELTGVRDHSGFKLHLTSDLREYDIGILWTGIQIQSFLAIPPKTPSFKTYGYCDTSPLTRVEGQSYPDMKILGSILHTHLAGSEVRVLQFRDGKQVGILAQDKSYDFNLQETRMLKEPVDVRRGGLATTAEMCLAFHFYYPKNDLVSCLSYQTFQMVASSLNISAD